MIHLIHYTYVLKYSHNAIACRIIVCSQTIILYVLLLVPITVLFIATYPCPLFSAAPRIRLLGVASMASDVLFLVCTVVRTPVDGPAAVAEEVEGLLNMNII